MLSKEPDEGVEEAEQDGKKSREEAISIKKFHGSLIIQEADTSVFVLPEGNGPVLVGWELKVSVSDTKDQIRCVSIKDLTHFQDSLIIF